MSQSGPGSREVAYRVFAAEFESATIAHRESDEELAPNYVISPTGGRLNRIFAIGVLTQTAEVGGGQIRARINDLTGSFVTYAGQYQPEAMAFLDGVTPPAFLALSGKARTFEPEDGDRVFSSVRPESVNEVDTATRDRWVVRTAEHTIERIGSMAAARRSGLEGEPLKQALIERGSLRVSRLGRRSPLTGTSQPATISVRCAPGRYRPWSSSSASATRSTSWGSRRAMARTNRRLWTRWPRSNSPRTVLPTRRRSRESRP